VCKKWLDLLHCDPRNSRLRRMQPNEQRIQNAEYSSKIANALQPLATARRRELARFNVTPSLAFRVQGASRLKQTAYTPASSSFVLGDAYVEMAAIKIWAKFGCAQMRVVVSQSRESISSAEVRMKIAPTERTILQRESGCSLKHARGRTYHLNFISKMPFMRQSGNLFSTQATVVSLKLGFQYARNCERMVNWTRLKDRKFAKIRPIVCQSTTFSWNNDVTVMSIKTSSMRGDDT
jgi:hypothetical protein